MIGENAIRKSSFFLAFDCWATSKHCQLACRHLINDGAEHTISQVNQVQSFAPSCLFQLLKPYSTRAVSMAPVKHDPLRHGDDALLGFI